MTFRFLTSGESHGKCLNAIIEGFPAGLEIDFDFINNELAKRQKGYGRGNRMKIETDKIIINSGVRFGISTGAPICLEIINKDFSNWEIPMSVTKVDVLNQEYKNKINEKKITKVRPGHADLTGALKYNHQDVRNILERSSARETTSRVAVGSLAKLILKYFNIEIFSFVTQIGKIKLDNNIIDLSDSSLLTKIDASELHCPDENTTQLMKDHIDEAKEKGVTLGGKFKVVVKNCPVGLGSFVHWDRKIDAKLSQAIMSIPAVKAVLVGEAEKSACLSGDEIHDEIFYENGNFYRKTNNAGGIEGGMTNGEDIVIEGIMKPIPTMKAALHSVDLLSKEEYQAHFERSDVCAVSACGVVAEAMVAIVLAQEFLTKFSFDNIAEIKLNYENYLKQLSNR